MSNIRYETVFKDRKTVPTMAFLLCPSCGSNRLKTMTTAAAYRGEMKGVGRRRKCHDCGQTFRTIETV